MRMQSGAAKRLFLQGATTLPGAGTRLGEARLLAEDEVTGLEACVLDTFDTQVRQAGRCLIGAGGELVLFGPEPAEQTAPLPGFVGNMAPGPVTDQLAGIVDPLRRLLEQVPARADGVTLRMVDELDKTVARCRLWQITPPQDSEPDAKPGPAITIAEFLPLRGYDDEMAALEALITSLGRPLADAGAAQAALLGPRADYRNKPVIPMTPDAAAFDVATAFLSTNLAVARQNEPGVIDDLDSEFLHDYRVALRRVRSVLSLFKGVYSPAQTDALKARFGALMARTGRLRDLDVYMLERDRYAALVPAPFRPGIHKLFDALASDRKGAHDALRRQFRSAAYDRDMTDLAALLAASKRLDRGPAAGEPARDYARALIWKRYRKVCRIAATIDDATPDEQVHELRIQGKKLRYLIEFFSPLFDAQETAKVMKSLKKLQNTLGAFNDYSVQQAEMVEMLARLDPRRTPDVVDCAASVGALVTLVHQKQLEARGRVVARFAEFDAPETRDKVRALFKPGKTDT